jgi:hypothetical protein
MDPITALSMGGSLASITGLSMTLLQWIASSKESKAKLTIEEYLEWLRRRNHEEVLDALRDNQSALSALEALVDQLKDSVVQATLLHETGSERRHRELLEWLAQQKLLDYPKLEIQTDRGVEEAVRSPTTGTVFYQIQFRVVNVSKSHATITGGTVIMQDGDEEIQCQIPSYNYDIPPDKGSMELRARTKPLPLQNRGDRKPEFRSLKLKLAQDEVPHTFVPGEGKRLRQITVGLDDCS